MALSGKVGAVYVSDVDAAPVPFIDEPTTPDAERRRYQVTDPDYRYWSLDAAITVRVDDIAITSGFTLERAGGVVVFDVALDPLDVVTVSGTALTMVQGGGFFKWSFDAKGEDSNATTFESGGWKEFLRAINGWSGSAEAYWGDRQFFDSLGQIIVVKLFADAGASQRCFEGFALITSEGIETSVDALVQDSIDFEGVGPLYPRL
ncbi:MAG: hypothetical protein RDU89_07020 [bacterium]|nr:hypothetical protein [bacterium]